MSKDEAVAQSDDEVWIEIKNSISHNGVVYPKITGKASVMKVSPQVAKELFALRECNCPMTIGGRPDHDCTGPLLNHAVPYELVRPEPVRPVAAVDASTGGPIDASTHKLNVQDAIALIDRTDDAAKLTALSAGEKKHPTFQGGRKTVLDAITARLTVLAR